MIDIGVNLNNPRFNADRADVIHQAVAAGVNTMIVTGTSVSISRDAERLCRDYPQYLYSTAGIHPHEASSFNPDSIARLSDLLVKEKVVAVGECGLDFNRNFSTPDEQLSCFEMQLELAVEFQMPVFLHQRDAHKDFLRLIKKYRNGLVDAVSHCFTGNRAEMESYLEQDLYIGITGWVCDQKRGQDLQEAVRYLPLDKLMVETDAPYLFPADLVLPKDVQLSKKQNPKKRKSRNRNEPEYLPHIITSLARFMALDEQKVREKSTQNAQRFFNLQQCQSLGA